MNISIFSCKEGENLELSCCAFFITHLKGKDYDSESHAERKNDHKRDEEDDSVCGQDQYQHV